MLMEVSGYVCPVVLRAVGWHPLDACQTQARRKRTRIGLDWYGLDWIGVVGLSWVGWVGKLSGAW